MATSTHHIDYNNLDNIKSLVFDKNDFNVLYINIVSLRKNLSKLQTLIPLLQVQPDLILLTETRLHKNETKYHGLTGYKGIFTCRERYVKKSGGGVAIFAKDHIKYNIVRQTSNSHDSFLVINIPALQRNFGVVYSPPDSNKRNFLYELNNSLLPSDTFLYGDFNINLLALDKPIVNEYLYTITSSGFKILNKTSFQFPTRITDDTRTIIDHVLSNQQEITGSCNLISNDISDHLLVSFSMRIPNLNNNSNNKKAEPIKIVNYEAINNYLQKHPIIISPNNNSDTNNMYDDFSNQLSIIVNKFTTYKTPKPTLYLKPWMSAELISLIQTKNVLYKCHKKDPKNTHTKECFTKINTKVTNLRRALKKRYFSKADCKVINAKFCWKLLNEIIYNKIKIKLTDIPPKITNPTDQSTTTDEHEILNSMNNYFCNIGKAMNDSVKSKPSTNPNTMSECNASMYFPKTNETEILNIIKKLKVNSSPGPDQFQTKLIQKCASNLIKPLTHISNSMITSGCFPDNTKVAKVIPVFKEGDKFLCSNYRPISVLSVFSKIFENLMLSRILTFLKSQSLISEKQFGFCEKSSTQAATINLLSTLQKRIDSKPKNLGALLFIDLSKAFDSINTLLLIKKCQLLGIRGPALKLLTSFLTDRKQFIYNGKTMSETLSNLFGVPQGGLSSPTLFNIFINDIVNLELKGDIVLYADDICVSYNNTSVDNIKNDMQHDLDVITNWLNFNQLTMNAKKTKFMIISPSKPPTMCSPPLINNVPIEQVNSYKYLGLVIDEQLKWKSHIKHIINKIAPITGVLWRTRHYTSLAMRRKIYFALIHSHLNYLVAIWGNTYKSHLKPLRTIQNKALKIVYNYEWRKNTIQLYAQTKILNITNLTHVNMSIFMYQITNKLIKTNIICLKNNQIHEHELRNASDFKVDGYRTHVGAFETSRKASQTFNNLPPKLKEINNLKLFKRLTKKHYVNLQITLDNNQLCIQNQ